MGIESAARNLAAARGLTEGGESPVSVLSCAFRQLSNSYPGTWLGSMKKKRS